MLKDEEPSMILRDGNMTNLSLIDEIEQVLVSEVGPGGGFLITQYLNDLGLTRNTFNVNHVPGLVEYIMNDYEKVLGTHANFLRLEINKKVTH